MPLTNKFLRYSPEITLEIFTLIINKLISIYGESNRELSFLEPEFNNYTKNKYYIVIEGQHFNWSLDNNTQGNTETTVQEILGYNPFVKDDFVLPEKWCIKRNNSRINAWLNKNNSSGSTYEALHNDYAHIPDIEGYHLFGHIQNGYIEITLEQFQKHVLKTTEQPKVMEKDWSKATEEELLAESKRRYPIGCTIKSAYDTSFNKTIDSDVFMIGFTEDVCYGSTGGVSVYSKEYNRWAEIISLPETKVESKSIEKWSVGSCVVFCKNVNNIKKGYVDIIQTGLGYDNCIYLEKYLTMDISREKSNEIKWFATKSEAEEFAKTLVEPVKEEVKQPLKQAVHCKTQEEWNFVCNKNGYSFKSSFKNITAHCIRLDREINSSGGLQWCKDDNYQILSFQEWCDLNGYKMEKEVKFEIGKWYKIREHEYIKFARLEKCIDYNRIYYSEIIDRIFIKKNDYVASNFLETYALSNPVSLEEIQQYLPDNHPDKIKVNKAFKVGDWVYHRDAKVFQIAHLKKDFDQVQATNLKIFGINAIRHATPEEINNYLISIGQITRDEPLNTGIKPNKDGNWTWESQLADNSLATKEKLEKAKMILSIDDEELPMVNIIKTNSIKQLLNND